jgi:hypothetical protein
MKHLDEDGKQIREKGKGEKKQILKKMLSHGRKVTL